MAGFTNIEVKTSSAELVAEALSKLTSLMEAKYPGWKANQNDITTILIEALGPLAADVMGVAATTPEAVFRAYGQQLIGLAPNEGASATVSSSWTLSNSEGHTIPAGTQVAIGNFGFYVESEVVVPNGKSIATVQLVALEQGPEYNGLSGTAELVEGIDWVQEITLSGETSGGVEAETNLAYLERLQSYLTLQAPRPITAANYSTFILDLGDTVLPSGVVVGRATSIDGFNPAKVEPEGTVTSGSEVMKEITSLSGISVGTILEGTDIPTGTTVKELKPTTELKMSAKATGNPGKKVFKAYGSYENERTVTTFVTNNNGEALSSTNMGKLQELGRKYREVNFLYFVEEPTYTKIYVTAKIHALPEFSATAVKEAVIKAMETLLSPATWENAGNAIGGKQWLNTKPSEVRYNTVLGAIEKVLGVGYVFAGSEGLAIGTTASPTETNNIVLVGPAPLPKPGTITVTTG